MSCRRYLCCCCCSCCLEQAWLRAVVTDAHTSCPGLSRFVTLFALRTPSTVVHLRRPFSSGNSTLAASADGSLQLRNGSFASEGGEEADADGFSVGNSSDGGFTVDREPNLQVGAVYQQRQPQAAVSVRSLSSISSASSAAYALQRQHATASSQYYDTSTTAASAATTATTPSATPAAAALAAQGHGGRGSGGYTGSSSSSTGSPFSPQAGVWAHSGAPSSPPLAHAVPIDVLPQAQSPESASDAEVTTTNSLVQSGLAFKNSPFEMCRLRICRDDIQCR